MPIHEIHYVSVAAETAETHHDSYAKQGQSGEDFIFGGLGLDVIDGGDDIDTCKVIDEQNYDIVIKCESNE